MQHTASKDDLPPGTARRSETVQRSPHLRADCARCSGLCCVAPPFDEQQGFGFSKPAHTPCTHLQADFRCGIHAQLKDRGFPACSAFDCHGAGQRVTALFRGQSWRDSPEAASRMFEAYARYRALHELRAMLEIALEYVLPENRVWLTASQRQLEALCDSGDALSVAVIPRQEVLHQIREALGRTTLRARS